LELKPDARRDVRSQVVLVDDIVLPKGRVTQATNGDPLGQRGEWMIL
jgi:hypothetical protein